MNDTPRGAFKSNFGLMMAVAGSAVGLGNIWRFPFLAGQNGGAAFLLLYLGLVLLVGLPMILSEFVIGRASRRGAVGSFKLLSPGTRWYGIGYLAVITGFVILGFYSVVAGWTIRFLVEAASNNFVDGGITESFDGFVNSAWQPILYSLLFVGATAAIVAGGVEKGIEKYSKILMPMLLVTLVLLAINSVTLSGFSQGMEFLFKPDFSKITMNSVFDAIGQVFFTLSIGMGVMITYSSYVVKDENMVRSKGIVTVIDTSVAIVSGIAVFPAVFTYGLAPTQGPSLVFLALPNVFAQMPGGYFVGLLFFVLLLIAALTSAISITEMVVAYFMEEFKLSRIKAILATSGGVMILATVSALSQVEGSSIRIFGINFFDFLDMLSANYLLTIGGLLTVIFTGWVLDKKLLYNTFTSGGRYAVWLFKPFMFMIKFFCPFAIAMIILSKLGIF